MTPDWSRVYDILRVECGATEYWRNDFLTQMADGCREYRFQGALGFGGKLWFDGRLAWVGYYSEDRLPERDAMVNSANERIKALVSEVHP